MENNTAIRNYFTETEWDAIFDAICEFQDHGEDEHLISHTIQMKIRDLFANWETMNQLEMLSAREQLMEDIDCIIESNFGEVEYKDDVIRQLCDAVCRNFPGKVSQLNTKDGITTPW